MKITSYALALYFGSGAAAVPAAVAAHADEDEGTPAQFLSAATTLLERRQPEDATAFLDFALDHHPLDADLNLLYLDLLTEQGLEDLARASYEEKLAQYGDAPVLLYALGRLATDAEAARSYYNRALAADATFAPPYVGLATLALAAGDADAAAEEVARAIRADADDRRAYAVRGTLALQRSDLDAAETDFTRALAGEPYAPATHAALARTYYLQKNAAAVSEYRAAVALNPARGAYYLGLAQALEANGEATAALMNYRVAADRAEGDRGVAVAALTAAGRLALAAGDVAGARRDLEAATALAPEAAEANALLRENFRAPGEPAAAGAAPR